MTKKYVLVTTKYRGVFAGEMIEDRGDSVVLGKARNCVYWDTSVRGFLGLASSGPGGGCRIGPAVDSLTLYGVTSVTPCTDEAREKWEAGPWS